MQSLALAISIFVSWTGADSKVTKPQYHLIRDTKAWTQLWQQHKGAPSTDPYDTYYDPLTLPAVNFEKCMVLAIFEGSRWNSAGILLTSAEQQGETILVRFTAKNYQTLGPDGGGKRSSCYGFFVIPRSDKALKLEENTQNRIGKPRVWTHRKTFPPLK